MNPINPIANPPEGIALASRKHKVILDPHQIPGDSLRI